MLRAAAPAGAETLALRILSRAEENGCSGEADGEPGTTAGNKSESIAPQRRKSRLRAYRVGALLARIAPPLAA